MEFIVKLYVGKPSRLGVKYLYEHQALREYETLLKQGRFSAFRMIIEPLIGRMDLTLVSEITGTKTLYKNLDFKAEQLKQLYNLEPGHLELHFVHVYSRSNALLIAKPFKREEFISISGVEFQNSPYA